ncbi:DUF805 domain-containing protein [Marinomonas spartinae]|uniref:DUF805 domain-containing protein n=1 Tax=Marinomonas spartinae TaxID=1792290 RepID=UPI0018F27823|nr:DUF805 domain-containing protein [Marinomonas spartinae]MBJ7554094.1 DUF805 domain-containing protein [Marinomonas spartinae]
MNGYFDGWRRFWQFSGRASRGAFLTFFLGNMLSLTVRRLHDTNRSGWWCVLVIKNFI